MFTNDTLSTFDGVMFVLNSDQGGSARRVLLAEWNAVDTVQC